LDVAVKSYDDLKMVHGGKWWEISHHWWEMVGNGGKFPTTGGKWWEIFGGHISHQAIFPLCKTF